MTVQTRYFRDQHDGLSERAESLAAAARRLPGAGPAEREKLLEEAAAFLRDEVEPHTKLDERVLYPEVNARLRDPLATATMNYDHIAIRGLIDDLATADRDDVAQLQELLYGLYALLRVHIWKEERLYLAMLDAPGWPAG